MRILILTAIMLGAASCVSAQGLVNDYPTLPWAMNLAPTGAEAQPEDYSWSGKTSVGNFSFSHLSLIPTHGMALSMNGVRYTLWFFTVGKEQDQLWTFKRLASSDGVASAELTDAPYIGEPLGTFLDTSSVEYRDGKCTLRGCRHLYLSAETKKVKWRRWEWSVESDYEPMRNDKAVFFHAKYYLP